MICTPDFKLTIKNVEPGRESRINWRGVRPDIKINGSTPRSVERWATTRNVYLYNGPNDVEYIIKVCRPDKWKHVGCQTEAEIKLWRLMDDEDRKYFIPLVGWGKTMEDKIPFVIQPYVTGKPGECPSEEKITELYKVLEKYRASGDVDFEDYGDGDWWSSNCLLKDGQLKVYDWGINKYTRYCDEQPTYCFERS
jgi:hypothetical protein